MGKNEQNCILFYLDVGNASESVLYFDSQLIGLKHKLVLWHFTYSMLIIIVKWILSLHLFHVAVYFISLCENVLYETVIIDFIKTFERRAYFYNRFKYSSKTFYTVVCFVRLGIIPKYWWIWQWGQTILLRKYLIWFGLMLLHYISPSILIQYLSNNTEPDNVNRRKTFFVTIYNFIYFWLLEGTFSLLT